MENTNVQEKNRGKKRLVLSLATGVGILGLITAAAFADFANLNLGDDGIGAGLYNIQVVDTDPISGAQINGSWQEADTAEGAPIAILGADTIFPGSPDLTVEIPVRNDSTTLKSSLEISLSQIPDAPPKITSSDYLNSLRFDVSQPATSIDASSINESNLTFNSFGTLDLNKLEANEESVVVIKIRLLSQVTSGATYTDNSLNGSKAYIQANFTGSSIN